MYLYLAIHIQEVRFEFYSMGRGLYDFQLHPFIFLCPCGNILLVLKPSCCRVKSVVNKVYFLSYEGAVSGAHQLLGCGSVLRTMLCGYCIGIVVVLSYMFC